MNALATLGRQKMRSPKTWIYRSKKKAFDFATRGMLAAVESTNKLPRTVCCAPSISEVSPM
jgi:hypothetical protein